MKIRPDRQLWSIYTAFRRKISLCWHLCWATQVSCGTNTGGNSYMPHSCTFYSRSSWFIGSEYSLQALIQLSQWRWEDFLYLESRHFCRNRRQQRRWQSRRHNHWAAPNCCDDPLHWCSCQIWLLWRYDHWDCQNSPKLVETPEIGLEGRCWACLWAMDATDTVLNLQKVADKVVWNFVHAPWYLISFVDITVSSWLWCATAQENVLLFDQTTIEFPMLYGIVTSHVMTWSFPPQTTSAFTTLYLSLRNFENPVGFCSWRQAKHFSFVHLHGCQTQPVFDPRHSQHPEIQLNLQILRAINPQLHPESLASACVALKQHAYQNIARFTVSSHVWWCIRRCDHCWARCAQRMETDVLCTVHNARKSERPIQKLEVQQARM